MAAPLIAAMIGLFIRRMRGTRSARVAIALVAMPLRPSPSMLGGGMVSRVSAPEQKPLPVPVSTTQVMPLSASISSNTAASGTMSSNAIEFIRSGRFIRMTAVPGRALDEHDRFAGFVGLGMDVGIAHPRSVTHMAGLEGISIVDTMIGFAAPAGVDREIPQVKAAHRGSRTRPITCSPRCPTTIPTIRSRRR